MGAINHKKEQGQKGEDQACAYLIKNGYTILERNYRTGNLELDIIALQEDLLVFVEVRLRATNEHGNPEDLMSNAKINFVKRAAEAYVYEHEYDGDLRFDLISILEYPKYNLMHFEDAYY